jgi:mannan endo-1,4-beta-mannosidase
MVRQAVGSAVAFLAMIGVVVAQPSPQAGNDKSAAMARERHSAVLPFLRSISGKQVVSGQHNKRSGPDPFEFTKAVYAAAGKYPGLFGVDFSHDRRIKGRWEMIYEAERQWKAGALINIMWHTCPPTTPEPCDREGSVKSKLSDSQWKELITDGTALNQAWKMHVDIIAPYLEYLKDKGVEVLWRPLHEMNQGNFWWGGRPGPDGTRRLYQITHDHLMKKGLTNLIWVWDLQDLSWDFKEYDPGDDYWDVLAFDVYGSSGYTRKKYDAIMEIAGSKPMAIGECGKLPTAAELASQPRWTFFMGWSELTLKMNSADDIKALYHDQRVLTLGAMPGWNGAARSPGGAGSATQGR